jgi:hypothetical protein
MVSFVELLWGASAVCLVVTLYCALRKHRTTSSWGLATAVGLAVSAVLELYLRMG